MLDRAGIPRLTSLDRAVLATWLWSRAAVYLVGGVAGLLFAQGPAEPVLARFRQWDVDHYQAIAASGYHAAAGDQRVAFFPGLPLLLRGLSSLGLDLTFAGLLVSAVAGGVGMLALARLALVGPDHSFARGARPTAVGERAVLLLVASPCAVFLAVGYTEALFLGLALPAWVAARRDRWWLAGLLGAGAASVRVTGIFLAVALVVEWVTRARRHRRDHLLALAVAFVPPVAYMAWLKETTGDWLAWADAQRIGWGRSFTYPWTALERTWDAAFGTRSPGEQVMFRAELVAMAVGVCLTLWLLARRRWGETVYIGLQVGALMTSTWFFSVPRATLLWWPLWLGLAALTLRHRWLLTAYLCLLTPLAVLWTAAFVTQRWAG